MKKMLLVLLLITGLNAVAQTERAFFTQDSASMINITKLVIETAKNKYHFEKAIPQKRNVEFWYLNDSSKYDKVKLLFRFLPDSINSGWILIHVTGPLNEVFPFWKKYFDADAVITESKSARETKYISTPFLNGKTMYHFGRIGSDMGEIFGGYIPYPEKKN